jgi:hypothetical protein
LNRPPGQQQPLGQGGLAGIGVRDDGEGAPTGQAKVRRRASSA